MIFILLESTSKTIYNIIYTMMFLVQHFDFQMKNILRRRLFLKFFKSAVDKTYLQCADYNKMETFILKFVILSKNKFYNYFPTDTIRAQ
ncbi:hypothetical protein DPV73_05840 [Leptospira mayottensis]|nr:hypothetical protein DPV73_05840 [Leptospira mayottensis]